MNNPRTITFDELLHMATIDDEVVWIDWFDADRFGMINEIHATDGRVWDVRTDCAEITATLRP